MRPRSPLRTARVVAAAVVAASIAASGVDASVAARDAAAQEQEWIPPVGGAVARPFVAPIAEYAPGHRGVDLVAPAGVPVRAANDGTVSFAGTVAGALHVVVAHDGGIRTSYSFLASADVRVGQQVARGQIVGRAGGTGEGHGAGVLHFGVRIGDRYVDPMLLFRPRDLTAMVRLVPADERAAASASTSAAERRELQRIVEELSFGCAVCAVGEWVADRAAEALDAGLDLLESAGAAGLRLADEIADSAHAALDEIVAAADALRDELADTAIGRLVQDLVAAGTSFLGWFWRECDESAPPANGQGGSGNVLMAVSGNGSSRGPGDDQSFPLAADKLGYEPDERYWFSYREGSEPFTQPDTQEDLEEKARLLGEQLKQAARERPGRTFDLVGHSQGGVVIALFLATIYQGHEDEYPPIEHAVTFASPLKGTPAASLNEAVHSTPVGEAVLELVGAVGGPESELTTALRQLTEDSEIIEKIEEAGLPESVAFTSIAATEDVFVPVHSTELEGARHHAIDVGGGPLDVHRNIVKDPRALMAARAALEDRPLPCTSFQENLQATVGSTLVSAAERAVAEGLDPSPV